MSTLDDNWGSMPTPTEAATLLRQYARKHNLPAGDNNFEDAANVITRLQSALEARGWQPIETAPKGTKIDLFDATAGIRAPDCYFHKKAQKWMCKWYGREGYSALRLPFSPTHWCATPPAAAIRKLQEQS